MRTRSVTLAVLFSVVVLLAVQSVVGVLNKGSSGLAYASQDSSSPNVAQATPTSTEVVGVSPLPPPARPPAPSQYRQVGAKTTQSNEGISAQIQVTNPSVKRRTYAFFCAWVMEHTDVPAQRWIQVGWAEVGWKSDKQYVFVYETQHQAWHFYEQFSISTGSTIEVRITHRDTTVWEAWLWWSGSWVLLDTADTGFSSSQYADQYGEVYLASGSAFAVPDTSFYDTRLLVAGSWNLWNTSYATAEFTTDSPYEAHWLTKYWDWHFHKIVTKK